MFHNCTVFRWVQFLAWKIQRKKRPIQEEWRKNVPFLQPFPLNGSAFICVFDLRQIHPPWTPIIEGILLRLIGPNEYKTVKARSRVSREISMWDFAQEVHSTGAYRNLYRYIMKEQHYEPLASDMLGNYGIIIRLYISRQYSWFRVCMAIPFNCNWCHSSIFITRNSNPLGILMK